MDFSEDGTLLACADDNTLVIYDALNAKKMKTLFNKVNGISNVRFTHSNDAVICSCKNPPCKYYSRDFENVRNNWPDFID